MASGSFDCNSSIDGLWWVEEVVCVWRFICLYC